MKRIFSILLAFTLSVSVFTACGNSNNMPADDGQPVITLALRSGIYSDVIKSCIAQYEADNQVHCNILELDEGDLHSKIEEDAANPQGSYDLCMVDGSWMAEFTRDGILTSLSSLGYELDDDIIPATTDICYHNDEVYLTPYYGNVTVLLYNKSLIQKAGYEASNLTSLQDMLAVCQTAKASGNYGFMYRGDSTNNYVVDFLPILLSYGGWVVDEHNQPTIDTPEFQEAMEFYMELIKTGKAESRDNLVMAIANNAAAMAIGWPGWYTPGRKSTADYSALTGKRSRESTAYNANVYGIWTLGIPENSQNKELAINLLNYLMDAKVQKDTIPIGGVPCRYSSLKDPSVLNDFPQYEAVCNALENGIYRPIMADWPQFYEILGSQMEQIIDGKTTIEAGLKTAQSQLDHLLSAS